jgi:hypothetical protein
MLVELQPLRDVAADGEVTIELTAPVNWRARETPVPESGRRSMGREGRSAIPKRNISSASRPEQPEGQTRPVPSISAPAQSDGTEFVEIPPVSDTARIAPAMPRLLERNLSEPVIDERQAFEELGKLLTGHPEFRNLILKEMIAGDGRVPGRKWMLDMRLADILKFERFLSPYEYELMKGGGGGYTGPYDPVHGFDRDKRKGFLVNVFELLGFVKKLLGLK